MLLGNLLGKYFFFFCGDGWENEVGVCFLNLIFGLNIDKYIFRGLKRSFIKFIFKIIFLFYVLCLVYESEWLIIYDKVGKFND